MDARHTRDSTQRNLKSQLDPVIDLYGYFQSFHYNWGYFLNLSFIFFILSGEHFSELHVQYIVHWGSLH